MLTRSDAQRLASSHKQRAKTKYGLSEHFTAEEWMALCERHRFRCVMCGVTPEKLSPDHMLPLVKGGSNKIENIAPTCLPCNLRKHTKVYVWTPNTRKIRRPSRRYTKRVRIEQRKQKDPLINIALVLFGVWSLWPLVVLSAYAVGLTQDTIVMIGLLWMRWLWLTLWTGEASEWSN